MSLDREQVVRTAIALLDEVGLNGLSLRRLAKELGVQAPALYWHFTNKQELLDQMVEMIVTTEAPARPLALDETWDVWLAERARQHRAALNRHRDGAMLAASTHPRPGQWPEIEMQLEIIMTNGLAASEALDAMFAIGNYVSGFTLEEQADRLRGEGPPDESELAAWLTQMAPYPRLVEALRVVGDPQNDRAFESGLALIIDGIRSRIPSAATRQA
jgi:TetR/AcrR family tetracycline transcriptional repressor